MHNILQLKKLIDEVVSELSLLGLDPAVLHDLLHDDSQSFIANSEHSLEILDQRSGSASLEPVSCLHQPVPAGGTTAAAHNILQSATRAVYELAGKQYSSSVTSAPMFNCIIARKVKARRLHPVFD